jgi:hypothetical protein
LRSCRGRRSNSGSQLPAWAARGRYFEVRLGRTLHPNFPTIDKFSDGVATSIKSIDLNAATYQDATHLAYRVRQYINDVSEFDGATWANYEVNSSEIKRRAVSLAIPKGSMTTAQREELDSLRLWARMKNDKPVDLMITEF